ncbi:hypothetical protein VTK73DRAFT_10042 [Phialemonium thermophilum]|uniref:Aspartate/glutamate racemase family protein n=1 Tax=Phialemonium thermophilum TaxID=223376 RepID=A0ABR3XHQ4_9PEZI
MSAQLEGRDPSTLPPLGFIAIDITFHRPRGDPWNPETWPFPLIRVQAEGSTEAEVVRKGSYDPGFLDRFVEAGKRLVEQGCVGIITSCGFLIMAQHELAARLPVPVSTSSLLQLPSIFAFLPPSKKVAVITYDDSRLGEEHFQQVGIPWTSVYVRSPPAGGPLRRVIADGGKYVHAEIAAELSGVAKQLLEDHSDIGAILLECTQMCVCAEEIQASVGPGVPVYDAYTNACWFYSGLVRRRPLAWGPPDT